MAIPTFSKTILSLSFIIGLLLPSFTWIASALQIGYFQHSKSIRTPCNLQPSTESDLCFDEQPSAPCMRRRILQRGVGMTMSVLLGGNLIDEQPAEASYSAYSRREEDWKEREKNGEILYTNAKQLRSQLREIAPMNSESSRIFCPNGPSAAVSPLMENKCGDRLALPSVYGRTNDAMGNSIPGFGGGAGESTSRLRDELNAQAYFR